MFVLTVRTQNCQSLSPNPTTEAAMAGTDPQIHVRNVTLSSDGLGLPESRPSTPAPERSTPAH